MIESVAKLFAEYGGLIGLLLFSLLILVAYLCVLITKISLRLIDFKRSVYDAGILPCRRKGKR